MAACTRLGRNPLSGKRQSLASRKGKAINFYDRELSRAFRGSHPLGSRKIARLAQGARRGHNFRNRVNRQRGRSLLTRKERQMLSSVLLLHRKRTADSFVTNEREKERERERKRRRSCREKRVMREEGRNFLARTRERRRREGGDRLIPRSRAFTRTSGSKAKPSLREGWFSKEGQPRGKVRNFSYESLRTGEKAGVSEGGRFTSRSPSLRREGRQDSRDSKEKIFPVDASDDTKDPSCASFIPARFLFLFVLFRVLFRVKDRSTGSAR